MKGTLVSWARVLVGCDVTQLQHPLHPVTINTLGGGREREEGGKEGGREGGRKEGRE